MTAYMFHIDSTVQCYHEHQFIWDNLLVNESLPYEQKIRNSHNPQVVAIKVIDGILRCWARHTCQGKYLNLFYILTFARSIAFVGTDLLEEPFAYLVLVVCLSCLSVTDSGFMGTCMLRIL